MAQVVSVCKSGSHTFSKYVADSITLIAGEGVEGDAHRGTTVKHRSRVRKDPTQPNLRQVHLIHHELIVELQEKGFNVGPGTLGENITTAQIDLLSLPRHTVLQFPSGAEVIVTGLRNPCRQLDDFQHGLTAAVLDKDAEGNLIRKAGIMTRVKTGGLIKSGDEIHVVLPAEPFLKLERV